MTDKMDRMCIDTFLEKQLQLFPEKVAYDAKEAQEFLEEMFAVVCNNLKEVRDYLERAGMDAYELSDAELKQTEEVFSLPDGRFLVVAG